MMLRKVLIAICMLAGVIVSKADITPAKPALGNGTKEKPYQITSAAELAWFSEQSNIIDTETHKNSYICGKLMNDIYYNGDKKVLDDNGVLVTNTSSLNVWTPIASNDNAEPKEYLGTFDGNGYTIYGLYCNNSDLDKNDDDYDSPIGFISYLGGTVDRETENVTPGVVKNLTIKDSYFYANGYAGGICGQNSDGDIICCASYATVKCTTDDILEEDEYLYGAGGICGYSYRGNIRNCFSKAKHIYGIYNGTIIGNCEETYYPSVISCFGGKVLDDYPLPLVDGPGKVKYDNESSAEMYPRFRKEGSLSESNVSDFRFSTGEIAYKLNIDRPTDGSVLQWGQTLYAYGDTTAVDAFPALRDSIAVTRNPGLMHRTVFYHPHEVSAISGTVKAHDYLTRWYPVELTWEGKETSNMLVHSITGIDNTKEPQGRVLSVNNVNDFKGKPFVLYNYSDDAITFAPPVQEDDIWVDNDEHFCTKQQTNITTYPYYNTVPGDWLNPIYSDPVTANSKAGYNSYVLQTVDGKRGFHIIQDGAEIKNSFYRCFLTVDKDSAPAKASFFIDFDVPTDINDIKNEGSLINENSIVYNMMGQRITNINVSKGTSMIYIVNGRKYVAR